MHPDYGLCPRGVLQICAELDGVQGVVLTASAVELTATEGNLCMFRKSASCLQLLFE